MREAMGKDVEKDCDVSFDLIQLKKRKRGGDGRTSMYLHVPAVAFMQDIVLLDEHLTASNKPSALVSMKCLG